MSYDLQFHPEALTEWKKLPKSIAEQFKTVLKRRLENPYSSLCVQSTMTLTIDKIDNDA